MSNLKELFLEFQFLEKIEVFFEKIKNKLKISVLSKAQWSLSSTLKLVFY